MSGSGDHEVKGSGACRRAYPGKPGQPNQTKNIFRAALKKTDPRDRATYVLLTCVDTTVSCEPVSVNGWRLTKGQGAFSLSPWPT